MPQITFSRSIGIICLCIWLMLMGASLLMGFTIPAWAMGLLAILAGLLILIGV